MSALKIRGPSANTDLRGELAGEYRILRKLGEGGFGTVYEAEHPLLKRRAAVKVLHANPALDSITVQRFIEEARSASQIRHRNIVDIFSFGTLPNGQYFYVMDLLDGVPLDRYLSEHGRLEPEQALPLLRPIANALDALHAASIVHRDVKPANIYLAWESSGELVPKLLDFGLVKLLGHPSVHTASGVPMGTPHYMSPEQCRGEKIDARTDIYALGVVCCELLTGSRPFSGDSATAILVAHVTLAPPRMSELCPDLSSDLDEPVLRMLAKDPEARPSSALAALRELELAAHDAGITLADGVPWLPRPVSRAPDPAAAQQSFAIDTTAAHSGKRSGTRPRRRAGLFFAGGAALLALGGGAAVQLSGTTAPAKNDASALAGPSGAAATTVSNDTDQSKATSARAEAAVPPSAAPGQRVAITLLGAPPGATVFLGAENLGEATQPVLLPYGAEPVRLRVIAAGYPPISVTVTPDAAHQVALTSKKGPRGPSKRGALPRDLENPF